MVFRFLMYEDRTQNYDPEIHEEYLTHVGLLACEWKHMDDLDFNVSKLFSEVYLSILLLLLLLW